MTLDVTRNFATFVTGPSNQAAFEAAWAVAHTVACPNPLVLYGPAGVGKTHLLEAISSRLANDLNQPAVAISLTSWLQASQTGTDDMERRFDNLRQRCLGGRVLLIDGVQIPTPRDFSPDELRLADIRRRVVAWLLSIAKPDRQVVLAVTVEPTEALQVDPPRSVHPSRYQAISLELPDLATRRKLVGRLVGEGGVEVPDVVQELVVRHCEGSVRELDSIVLRLAAKAVLRRQVLSERDALEIVAELLEPDAWPGLFLRALTDET